MKNPIRFILLYSILLLTQQKSFGQDRMILRFRTDTLMIKVLEVGVSEVKYKLWPVSESMPVMVESKEKVRRIIFENGTILKFAADEFTDATNYTEQRKMLVKIDMIAPTRKVFVLSVEKSLKPGISVEAGIGVIAQNNYEGEIFNFEKANGYFFRLGYKFINQPDFHMKGMRYTHILKGGYVKPELMLLSQTCSNSYSNSNYNYTAKEEFKTFGYAGFINFGKQWIMDDIFAVDLYVGLGLGAKKVTYIRTYNLKGTSSSQTIRPETLEGDFTGLYGFIVYSMKNEQMGFATQAGLKIGILIGSKKKQK
ncbi:MAG: hypothetical protein Q8M15_07400 [Bacteroidota bacterium]|nr:hypothetical protein [Bacteroidota bacterium]